MEDEVPDLSGMVSRHHPLNKQVSPKEKDKDCNTPVVTESSEKQDVDHGESKVDSKVEEIVDAVSALNVDGMCS